MNEVREGAAHKLKPIVSRITPSPSTSEFRLRTRTRTRYGILYYIGLRKIDNWVMGSNIILEPLPFITQHLLLTLLIMPSFIESEARKAQHEANRIWLQQE